MAGLVRSSLVLKCTQVSHQRMLCFPASIDCDTVSIICLYELFTEEVKRFEIFKANMAKVKKLQEGEQATGRYGATQFADMTGSNVFIYLLLIC